MSIIDSNNDVLPLKVVAKFEKVSFKQFKNDIKGEFDSKYTDDEITAIYNEVKIPVRATKGSAGYDIRTPISFALDSWEAIKIPTGIRVNIREGWFLSLVPRSGLGFKHFLRPANVPSTIDSDYFFSDNEGHIWVKIRLEKDTLEPVNIKAGEAIVQGIFLSYGVTEDDCADGVRNGGFGSTGR